MKKYSEKLKSCYLFDGIKGEELNLILSCLEAKTEKYIKKEIIICEGEKLDSVGIVISGSVQLERTDYYGNRNVIGRAEESDLFGESFAALEKGNVPFDILASENTEVMWININKIMYSCKNACGFHNKLIFNLLKIIATKNIFLNRKAEIISKRTTREKLMAYLFFMAKEKGTNSFFIPYDRQTLADYLEVERSGLSREISRLREQKIIKSHKNYFELLKNQDV